MTFCALSMNLAARASVTGPAQRWCHHNLAQLPMSHQMSKGLLRCGPFRASAHDVTLKTSEQNSPRSFASRERAKFRFCFGGMVRLCRLERHHSAFPFVGWNPRERSCPRPKSLQTIGAHDPAHIGFARDCWHPRGFGRSSSAGRATHS
jgi:hypothetical protein